MNRNHILAIIGASAGSLVQALCSADPTYGAALAAAGAVTASLGANVWSSAIDSHAEAKQAARDLLVNEDLAKATATAIRQRLRQIVGSEIGDESDRNRLKAIAERAFDWWPETVTGTSAQKFDALREGELVNSLTLLLATPPTPGAAPVPPPSIPEAAWVELLDELDQDTPGDARLKTDALLTAARTLHQQVLQDVYLALKADFAQEGKAYAAISLRFFAEILIGVRAVGQTQAELKPLLDQVPALLSQMQEAVAALRQAGLPPNLDNALADTERRLTDAITVLGREMHERFDEIGQAVAELRADLAAQGKTPADLSQDELERELASRVPGLAPVDLRRLMGYALFKSDLTHFDVIQYAPTELVGREEEMKLLNDTWARVISDEPGCPQILTFVALGGEGKTSLVAKWAANLASANWPGCDAVFAWTFYSQGTREQAAASSDTFLSAALSFFGDDQDKQFATSGAGAFEKGQRLARIIGSRRSLLILDGLEPLQYLPGPPLHGKLKDVGIAALLTGLATNSHGLCVVTTRYSIPDMRNFHQSTAPEIPLTRLSREAGVHLLRSLGVKGTQPEFEKLVEDVKGHALTLNLLGSFLRDGHGGDIRRRDLVHLEEADDEEQGGHAFRVMDAYVKSFENGTGFQPVKEHGQDARATLSGRRALALLELMGLFDRPASADCLHALWTGEAIAGLTEPLISLREAQRNLSLRRLEEANLLTVNRDAAGTLLSLDAHPLLREYFARRLRETQPEAWREGHRRLYEHLCATTKEGNQPTLEDLQPLYQAVAHGCQAGLQQQACDAVYYARIYRQRENYAANKLGAFGAEIGAVACFFAPPWSRVSPSISEADQAWVLSVAAFDLRAAGRLTEALETSQTSLEMAVMQEDWQNAAIRANNLSELELTLGAVAGAVADAAQAVTYADRSGDAFLKMAFRTTYADVLHQAGRRDESLALFRETEQMQAERQPKYPLLYSVQGFQYCDLLLAESERACWNGKCGVQSAECIAACRAVSARAAQTLEWEEGMRGAPLLDFALHHLSIGRAALFASRLEAAPDGQYQAASDHLEAAVAGLRRAGQQQHLPLGLLNRAWLRFLTGTRTGPDSAQSDLDEAWDIAERGPMKLFMADILLTRARLFCHEEPYPWESAQADLKEARRLIEQCGYGRRKEELEDAEAVILAKNEGGKMGMR